MRNMGMGAQDPKIKRRMLNRLSQPGAENRYPITRSQLPLYYIPEFDLI